jgi:hypothetical protein
MRQTWAQVVGRLRGSASHTLRALSADDKPGVGVPVRLIAKTPAAAAPSIHGGPPAVGELVPSAMAATTSPRKSARDLQVGKGMGEEVSAILQLYETSVVLIV